MKHLLSFCLASSLVLSAINAHGAAGSTGGGGSGSGTLVSTNRLRISTNGVTVIAFPTNLNVIQGTGMVVRATNTAGGANVQFSAEVTQAGASVIASNAATALNLWTNDQGIVRLVQGGTNAFKVISNGLSGVIIGDTNAASSVLGWPYDGLSYVNMFDGSTGHEVNESVHGVMTAAGNGGYFDTLGSIFGPQLNLTGFLNTNGSFATLSSYSLQSTGGVFGIRDSGSENGFGFQSSPVQAGSDVIGITNLMRFVWGAVTKLVLHTNGNLMVSGSMTASNGFASYSTIATNQIPTTGWTNNAAINVTVYTTATAVSFTINNRAGTVLYTSPTLTATVPVNLQPGWSIRAASGLTGTVLPF